MALGATQAASWLVTLVFIVTVPHYLGAAAFGRLVFATSFIGIFGLTAGLGVTRFITKMIARDDALLSPYVANALVLQLPLAAALAILAVAISGRVGEPAQTRLLVAIAGAGMVVATLNATIVAGLNGKQLIRRPAVWAAIERYVYTAGVLVALLAGRGVEVVAAVGAVSGLVSLTANALQLRAALPCLPPIAPRQWVALAQGGFPFLIWDAALVVYATIDVSMLSILTSDAVVGWYGLAYKLINVPAAVPTLALVVLFPALAAARGRADPSFVPLANRALRFLFLATAPMAAGLALTANDIVSLLHYPATFSHAVPLLRILALHVPLVALDTVLGAAIIAVDRQRHWVVVGCLAAILNPALNLLAIPLTQRLYGNGAIGAAVVTVLTETFMFVGAIALRPSGVLDGPTAGYLMRCLAASLLMAGLVALAHAWAFPWRVVLGVTVYVSASLLLRTVTLKPSFRQAAAWLALESRRRAPGLQ